MSYERRIVCDLDDTISITTTRDWENAEPIIPVIEKIRDLYSKGWEIWIVTARGQLSCNGDIVAAEKKYGEMIKSWLEKHNVPYHKLSFQKVLGAYYVDDKAMTPEEFSNLEIEELKGNSGAILYRQGQRVFKTEDNALNTATWYKLMTPFVRVPKLHSVIGKTLCMDFIERDTSYDLPFRDASYIENTLFKFDQMPSESNQKFSSYINRIENHLEYSPVLRDIISDSIFLQLKSFEVLMDSELKSFCHGDFTLDNMIMDKQGNTFLIDPIFKPAELYQSWVLDLAKFMHSCRRHKQMFLHRYLMKSFFVNGVDLILFELCEWIRIYKYMDTPDLKDMVIFHIKEIVKEMKKV